MENPNPEESLDGHNFQVIYRSDEEGGDFDASSVNASSFPTVPMRRDTILTPPDGNVVLRFRADNPGIWLFHCKLPGLDLLWKGLY
jgi:iron transport multicopper oxidase